MSNNTKPVVPVASNNNKEIGGRKNMIKVIGVGAAGNKTAMEWIAEGGNKADVVMINSTDKDFPSNTGDVTKIVLSPDNTGCGKERAVAKEYALTMLQAGVLDSQLEGYDKVVLVASTEGGTGSGAAPIIGQYCQSVLGKTVRIFAYAGFEDDSRGLQNTVEFFQELNYDCIVHCVKNSMFGSGSNKFDAEQKANEHFCMVMKVISGQELIASSQNIDDTDLDKVTSTVGYSIVDKIEFEQLMDVEAFNKLCKRMIMTSKAMKSAYNQLRMGVILNIRPESEDAVDYQFSMLEDTYGHPYEKFFHKQYDGSNQYLAVICAGMKLPVEEVKEIYEKYQERSQQVDKSGDSFFQEIGALKKAEEDNQFDMVRGKKTTADKNAFFKQFSGSATPAPAKDKK